MRILYLSNGRLPTEKAHGVQIMKTCSALTASGSAVTLAISSIGKGDEESVFAYYGLKKNFSIARIRGIALLSWGSLGYTLRSVFFALSAFFLLPLKTFDVIYTRDEMSVLILSLCGYKVYFEMHDVRNGFVQRTAIHRASGIVVISKGLYRYCLERGIASEKIVVAPDAVTVEDFAVSENREECRRRLGLPQDVSIILYAGHLYSWKGAHTMADSAKYFDPSLVAVFVGGTERDVSLFRSRFGSEKNIIIVGQKPHAEIPYYLKSADILVLPNSAKEDISRLYTSPMKLFEYMASGTPIVASDLPSIREVLFETNCSFAKPDNAVDLASVINGAVHNNDEAARRAKQASVDVLEYTWGKRAEKILSIIK